MPTRQGAPSMGEEAQPSLERCPNCDQPLRFPADQPEAYCPACGIFVESLRPLAPAAPERAAVEGNEQRLQTARLYLELDEVLDDVLEEEVEPGAPAEAPVDEGGAVESTVPQVEPETVPMEEPEPVPGPSAIDEIDAFAEEPEPAAPETAPVEALTEPSAVAVAASEPELPLEPKRWHRILFYAGSVLVAFGGSGLALGSLLHDVFRVPFFGTAYDAFGSLNVSAVLFGGLFLVPGLVAMLVAARVGRRRRHPVGG